MNARTFGKKGTATGENGGEAATASRRAAFVAQERARAEGESRAADTDVFPSRERTIADRVEFVDRPAKAREPAGPRSLPLTWALWFPWGLAGAHRLYLGRYLSGGIQAAIFITCVLAVFGMQIYPAFAGLAVSWLWWLLDGLKLKQLHAEAVGTPHGAAVVEV